MVNTRKSAESLEAKKISKRPKTTSRDDKEERKHANAGVGEDSAGTKRIRGG